ncbi:MazG nucleotide pyrophosphohydrolase domain-containing protein [Candidatus Poriferisodalis sp.]|uniref:MazG nucleotide pyrophosphohydrolase domain-containing protein n=1 Tax=Candidatus Poriferisodalis sp. TaxID=3101277 RepID=UPI003B02CEBB
MTGLDKRDVMEAEADLGERLISLHGVIARLRRECPWDRVQTHASLAPYAVDEVTELAEALQVADDALSGDPHEMETAIEDLVEELGDVLLQVLMNAAIGEQAGTFTLAEVLVAVEAKMLRRHPHVFERDPEAPEPTDAELSAQWEAIKAVEREARASRIAAREVPRN